MNINDELKNILFNDEELETMAAELSGIASNLYVLSSVVQPIIRPEGNPTADTIEGAFYGICGHLERISSRLNEIQGLLIRQANMQEGDTDS